ncbi:Ppx/GppA family phosphatase [Arthrobacter sp. zg-Y916]|uniref:Ppx/GppA phosphatase family protein n=1 Tax=Arthrobacter sp. zg-Y916 TaxID=2894190 RepID=UPI001E64321E|nr:Ppx/GppA family phosphatase [Arthrobacter sp. zg-Y916]MCC9192429.1 Ppx/GppA family phosphatase [Arthrobacter sp. zg-Y916]
MRLGVLDIGSNTVHLLLVDAHPGARPVPYASHKRPLQLVTHLDDDGAITDEGQRLLVEFVLEAREFAARHRARDLLAFSTSAIRESANGPLVLEHVEEQTGVALRELSGRQEASMTYLAARRWYGWGAGSLLDLDIGGGSFELAQGQDELPDVAVSVPLGAGRLTRDWLQTDPPAPRRVAALRAYIRDTVQDALLEFLPYGTPHVATGTSKTFRSLARVCGAAPSAAGPYAKRKLRRSDLSQLVQRLSGMSAADISRLDGVSALRAPQLLAGALVAEAAMEAFDLKSLRICPWALREGLILQRFDTLRFDTPGPLPAGPETYPQEPAGALVLAVAGESNGSASTT